MNAPALIFTILFILFIGISIYSIVTAEPYPQQLEDEDNEELLNKFKEYRDKKSQNY